jgi:hypothetical protein
MMERWNNGHEVKFLRYNGEQKRKSVLSLIQTPMLNRPYSSKPNTPIFQHSNIPVTPQEALSISSSNINVRNVGHPLS